MNRLPYILNFMFLSIHKHPKRYSVTDTADPWPAESLICMTFCLYVDLQNSASSATTGQTVIDLHLMSLFNAQTDRLSAFTSWFMSFILYSVYHTRCGRFFMALFCHRLCKTGELVLLHKRDRTVTQQDHFCYRKTG